VLNLAFCGVILITTIFDYKLLVYHMYIKERSQMEEILLWQKVQTSQLMSHH